MNIGILGGAFNPITQGHLDVAEYIINETDINRIWFTPCYKHRFDKVMLLPKIRLEMCELVCEDFDNIHTFNYEIKQKLTGSTYEFLLKLFETYDKSKPLKFSLIIGMDNANDIKSWHNYKELIQMVRFIVVPRIGIIEDLNIDWYCKPPHIYLRGCKPIEISSTQVREYLRTGQYDIADNYLYSTVFQFIKRNKLYIGEEVM